LLASFALCWRIASKLAPTNSAPPCRQWLDRENDHYETEH